jgi:flagellar hook-associated protein FlgK
MSLSSAALTAQTGLNAITAEAAVLSRNITGANDTGIYSRKTANVISVLGGSQVASITRASNQAVFDNLLSATSANATQQALSSGLDQLNQTIGSLSSSSSSTDSTATPPEALLSNFTNALQTYEASPSDSTLASAAVNAAAALAQGLNSATATVNQVREQADAGIATSVQSINSLLTQFQAGLAGQTQVNPSVDPNQGGNPLLLRDGGISGNPAYVYNTTGDASYQGRLSQLLTNLSMPTTFSAGGGITTSATLDGYATASVSWLEAQRSNAASQSSYQSTLLSAAPTALSNATGVNLDTEMSKMLDLENSYSATAKLLSTVDSMFGTLLTDLGNVPA